MPGVIIAAWMLLAMNGATSPTVVGRFAQKGDCEATAAVIKSSLLGVRTACIEDRRQ
jgi:hypothetical protein